MTIMLKSIEDVNKLVSITNKYNFEIDLISGRYAINGKSIMGIFSLDLTKEIEVKPQTNDCYELFEELKPFEVK